MDDRHHEMNTIEFPVILVWLCEKNLQKLMNVNGIRTHIFLICITKLTSNQRIHEIVSLDLVYLVNKCYISSKGREIQICYFSDKDHL